MNVRVREYCVHLDWTERFAGQVFWEYKLFAELADHHTQCCQIVGGATEWDEHGLKVVVWLA